jgi:DNA-binding response OmpR family regulator
MADKRKVLIVDDEEDFCFFMKMNLESTGKFEVSVCSDSNKSVKKAIEYQPDIIFLDIMMPGMSGSEVFDELRDNVRTQDIPVIFLTALVKGEETERNSNIIGGRYFVSKPVQMDNLVKLINKVLSS